MRENGNDLNRDLLCVKRDGSWAASVRPRDQHPICRQAADYITTLEAKIAEREAIIIKLGENAATAAKEYSARLAVAREALEDLCAEKHGARPRALRALKEIEQ